MKSKKSIILLLIILLCIISGCKDKWPKIEITTMTPEVNVEQIRLNLYRITIDKEDELPGFNELLKENFGIEVMSHSMGHITEPIVIANLDGLYYYPRSLLHQQLVKKEEKFYILNDFLKNNNVYNSLPKQLTHSLEDENGNIWYIPEEHLFYLDRRVYNEKIMEDLDLEIPLTLDGLFEIFSEVKTNYGEFVSVIEISPNHCAYELKDILEYYGIRIYGPNINRIGIIGWNEEANRFEDSIINLQAEELFNTIDFMKMNKMFSIVNDSSLKSSINTNKVFSNMVSTYKDYPYTSGPFHDSKEYIFNKNSNNIFVPLGTSKPETILNTFINTFYGDNKGNIIGKYGESGRTVKYNESFSFVILLNQKDFILNSDGMIYGIGIVGKWINNNYAYLIETKGEEEYSKDAEQREAFRMQLINKMVENKIEVLAPYKELYINGHDPVSNQNILEVNKLFQIMLYDYLETGVGREDFINEYQKEIKKTGMEQYINDHNEMVGAESLFQYSILTKND